ncbi:MAG: hypothetical protein L0Y56_15395, partial [Nitrospira sp.]|nr:hypothetical protein [Nitrospira sp.]
MLNSEKISIGRSDRPEEANDWEFNDIVVSDASFEPVQIWIYRKKEQFFIQNRGLKSVQIAPGGTQEWTSVRHVEFLKVGDKIKVGDSTFQLTTYRTGGGIGLHALQGQTQSYRIYPHKRNVLSGSRTIPGGYIPDTLVDEEFLENVRRCMEARLIYLGHEGPGNEDESSRKDGDLRSSIRVRGFTKNGKLIGTEFDALTKQEKRLLEQTFRFSSTEGSQLKWRRPFNRNREDPYLFDGTELENFIIRDGDLKGIYNFAARLVNPHVLQEELLVQRGTIYDRDRETLPRLVMSNLEITTPEQDNGKLQVKSPVEEAVQFLLINNEDRNTVIEISLDKPL